MTLIQTTIAPPPTNGACPYGTLGLSPGASQEEIRAAFRRQAARFHPDRTRGDPEAASRYARVVAAYETLCGKGAPDQKQIAALAILSECLSAILVNCAEKGYDTTKVDLATSMRDGLSRAISQHEESRGKLTKCQKAAQKALGRFRRRAKSSEPDQENLIEHLLSKRLEELATLLEQCQATLDATSLARKMLEDYEYVFDKQAATQVFKATYALTSTATGYWRTG